MRLTTPIRFRLRTLFVAVTIIGVVLGGWISREQQRRLAGRKALEAIERYAKADTFADGLARFILFRDSRAFALLSLSTKSTRTSVADALLGEERFERVEELTLRGPQFDDEMLMHVGALTGLRTLSIEDGSYTPQGFAHLAQLPVLEDLCISRPIGDDAIQPLVKSPRLRKLTLQSGKVTGESMKGFRALEELETLWCPIDDTGAKAISHLPNLKRLDMHCPALSDGGMGEFARMQNLKQLRIVSDQISGAGLTKLQQSRSLAELDIQGGRIDDLALQEISRLSSLRSLIVMSPQITNEGLQHLSQAQQLTDVCLIGERITDEAKRDLANKLPNARVR
jgi:Leucine-rich repeat (LRR) protein